VVDLDVMLAKWKMRSKELAERIGITEHNLSPLKSGNIAMATDKALTRPKGGHPCRTH